LGAGGVLTGFGAGCGLLAGAGALAGGAGLGVVVLALWAPGAPYCTDVTWLIGYVRASPLAACSDIAEVELLVTVPLNVEPSLNVTVACWPAAGAGDLLQPDRIAAIAIKIIALTILSLHEKLNADSLMQFPCRRTAKAVRYTEASSDPP
jgi:hypothetical protein